MALSQMISVTDDVLNFRKRKLNFLAYYLRSCVTHVGPDRSSETRHQVKSESNHETQTDGLKSCVTFGNHDYRV